MNKPITLTLRVLSHLLSYPDATLRAHLGELRAALHQERALGSARLAEMDAGPDGPCGGDLTDTQRSAIQAELTNLNTAFNTILSAQSENGRLSKEVDSATTRLTSRMNALDEAVGGIVNVDLAEVAVRLNQAQFAYQASSSVFNTLRGLTLLDVLR